MPVNGNIHIRDVHEEEYERFQKRRQDRATPPPMAAMGGADAVIFTAGIGQGSDVVRAMSLEGLECMGIELDATRNRQADGFGEISRISVDDSRIQVLIVPTDEERMMACEALRAIGRPGMEDVLVPLKPQPPDR